MSDRPLTDTLMQQGMVECTLCGTIVPRTRLAQERHVKRCPKRIP